MNTFKTLEFLKERERPIYKHGLVGLLIGYSFFHPLTMIIYYFEHHGLPSDFFQTISKITILIGLSFSAKMLPMAGLLALTGGLMGMFYGYATSTILAQNTRLKEREKKLKGQILVIEKQATLGIIAGSIGHEINNVLTGLFGYSELLQEESPESENFKKDLSIIGKYSMDLKKLARALLTLGKPAPSEKKCVSVNHLLDSVTETLVICGVLKRVRIVKKYSKEKLELVCDPFMLEQVLRNIEINASHAMDGEGELILETSLKEGTGAVCFRIMDSGSGIPEDSLQKVFDPFYTTKEKGKGTGLGLSISKQIIEQLGGEIRAENRIEGGAVFEIIFSKRGENGGSGSGNPRIIEKSKP